MKKSLKKSEIERFSRQIILKDIGSAGQEKIKKAKILIVGAGGLGCPVAEFLTRAGVGEIGIIDNDVVDISNIHRQSLYDISDLKLSKVQSAKKKLKKNKSKYTC
jgi:molybdopterin/thiamine biosynthesis adenylyltransferase